MSSQPNPSGSNTPSGSGDVDADTPSEVNTNRSSASPQNARAAQNSERSDASESGPPRASFSFKPRGANQDRHSHGGWHYEVDPKTGKLWL
jgi:hypothetical protein